MKLNPKGAVFCPGCPNKKLQLKAAPLLIVAPVEKQDTTKIVTVMSKPQKKTSSNSLF